MENKTLWMVRAGRNAAYADDFVEQNFVGIGFAEAAEISTPIDKEVLEQQIAASNPTYSAGKVGNVASQVKRFYEELTVGDAVMTYDPSQRLYFIGEIRTNIEQRDHVLGRARAVAWTKQASRDSLTQATRNTLGSILSLFLVRDSAADEVWANAIPIGQEAEIVETTQPTQIAGQLDQSVDDIESQAHELIDDQIAALDWEQLQELVAEILKAMGFRAETSDKGPDRGVDVIASPDGLGLKEPRVFVEVKHRKGTRVSADQIRAFIGGRQPGDKCLYVSTGGYTKEARYEAERSSIPLTLVDLPRLRSLVLERYDSFSPEGLALIPLKRIYWPID
jgi:restriction system protein